MSDFATLALKLKNSNFNRKIGQSTKLTGLLGKSSLATAGKIALVTAALTAASVVAVTSVSAFAGFEAGMRNVNTISRLSEDQFSSLSNEVLQLSAALNLNTTTTSRGLYDIASAGFQAADGLTVLNAAGMAAKAGLSGVDVTGKTITSILNAWGMEAEKAGHVSDVLFKTIELGVTTFPELAASMGNVISTASAMGVSLENVTAALATMTKTGISTAEATTALNRMLITFLNPSKELTAVFTSMGFESAGAALSQKGLGFVMKQLQRVTGGSAQAITDLGFQIRAFKAVASLATQDGRLFAEILDQIENNNAGSTMAAVTEQSKALAFQWGKLKNVGKIIVTVFGSAITDATGLTGSITDLNSELETLMQNISELKFDMLKPLVKMSITVERAIAALKIGWAAANFAKDVVPALYSMGIESSRGDTSGAQNVIEAWNVSYNKILDDLEESTNKKMAALQRAAEGSAPKVVKAFTQMDIEIRDRSKTISESLAKIATGIKGVDSEIESSLRRATGFVSDYFREAFETERTAVLDNEKMKGKNRSVVRRTVFGAEAQERGSTDLRRSANTVMESINRDIRDISKKNENNTKKTAEGVTKIANRPPIPTTRIEVVN